MSSSLDTLILTGDERETLETMRDRSQRLAAVLEMLRTDPEGEDLPAHAFVFGDEIGQSISSVKTAWRTACEQAGIVDLHFHDLRREFACRLLESRAELHDVRDFLGTPTSRRRRATFDQRRCGSNGR
jgi:integrase